MAFFNLVLMWPRAQRQKLEGNVATLHKLGRRTGKRLMLMMMMVMLVLTANGASDDGDNSHDETYHGSNDDKNSEI